MNKDFFIGLNNLRALVAIWVMLGHYYIISLLMTKIDDSFNVHVYSIIKFFDPVALFFLISGFLIPIGLKKYGSFKFLIYRFYRIFPIIFCLSILHYIILDPNFTKLFMTLFLLFDFAKIVPQVSVYWSLSIEIYFYLILAISFYIMKNNLVYAIFLGIFLTFLIFFIAYSYNAIYYMSVMSRYLSLLIFIFIGSSIYGYYETKNIKFYSMIIAILVLLLYLSMYFLHSYSTYLLFGDKFLNEYPEGIFCISEISQNRLSIDTYFYSKLVAIFLFFVAFKYFTIKSILLEFFAKISYPLYLSHLSVYYYVNSLNIHQNQLHLSIISILLTVLLSFILHKYVEIPMINHSKNR